MRELDLANKKDLFDIIKDPTKIAQILAGALALNSSEKILMVGRVVGAAINRQLFQQLGQEILQLQKGGKIKENYFETTQDQSAFCDLLKFIDEETPDEVKFKAMKSIFLYSITNNVDEREKMLAYELQKICKQMSSSEIVVLKAVYEIHVGKNLRIKESINKSTRLADEWLRTVSQQIGHNDISLVAIYEEGLMEKRLISGRINSDKGGVDASHSYRLSNLGIKLCEFISKY